ncbi:glycoside hydrolase family 3 C-terminal domain-containing protein [Streptomyces bluensis]|uniref:glycoside hydrolase family 3 C-terminal domain-containing protein n=1 Tax=Streptomyces bluensis TaxID=33897 RepID=UPI00199DC57E|nr:glycoside hydrolase family 3 C-terminal domain-containing protein [Streptomyces bluensis]GGZ95752.1 hypothetical protein GCM10010344_74860 [Streptomyces bluensis]
MTGRPVDLRWADANVPAIVQAWYPETRGGEAVAALLLGGVSPAGRLPFTWPRHVSQVPMVYAHYRTFEPDQQGARYFEEESTPLYPFGHGLTYGEFEYANLRVDSTSIPVGGTARVSVEVSNTSARTADEVVRRHPRLRRGRHDTRHLGRGQFRGPAHHHPGRDCMTALLLQAAMRGVLPLGLGGQGAEPDARAAGASVA